MKNLVENASKNSQKNTQNNSVKSQMLKWASQGGGGNRVKKFYANL
ncbi:MAG: hypothetical protein LBK82_01575 [Planctomycetaceae bacterium]|jgi:hypothetical protein|nr:hypothetical protein [Planctomycetaceae bacterium]